MISILLYNIGIRCYYFGISVASYFSKKADSWIVGRVKIFSRMNMFMLSAHGKRIWFHCASLGEFEQVRPLIEKIRQEHPKHILVLTFFSPSGFEAKRYYDGVDFVSYLPMDNRSEVRRFIRIMKPSLVIWVKYEFWYNVLDELKSKGIPVVLISSIFRPDQIFFRWYGGLHRRMLGFFSHIFVQNDASQQLLQTIGVASEICPDTRFDTVYGNMSKHKEWASVAAFKGDKKIFIAGSTWPKDIDIMCDMINNNALGEEFKYIIAPHDVSQQNLTYILKKIKGRKKVLFSRLTSQQADKYEVVIVDTIGKLSSLYYYGDIAYIGGGFGRSIHNILEPIVYGMPVIFGPRHQKSDEANTLLKHPDWHAAYTVKNSAELLSVMQSLLANEAQDLKTGSAKTKAYVESHTGGTERIYSYLSGEGLLD